MITIINIDVRRWKVLEKVNRIRKVQLGDQQYRRVGRGSGAGLKDR